MTTRYAVTVSLTGEISVETKNVTGPACLDAVDTIRKLVPGAEVLTSHLTDDYSRDATYDRTVALEENRAQNT